jgi:hypothetical protein
MTVIHKRLTSDALDIRRSTRLLKFSDGPIFHLFTRFVAQGRAISLPIPLLAPFTSANIFSAIGFCSSNSTEQARDDRPQILLA